jgi:hypothetical protein
MEKLRAQSGLYGVHYRGGNRAHYNSARSKDGSIVEQKFYGLFEQKKNHKAVSMVITLAQGLTLTILQAQSIRSRLYSVHYRGGNRPRYNSAKSTYGSIVSTKVFCLAATKLQRSSCLFTDYI